MGVQVAVARSAAEREAVYRLRYEVYVEEMGYAYPAADHRARLLPDEGSGPSRLLYAAHDDAVVGTLKLDCGAERAFTAEECRDYDLPRFQSVVPLEQMALLSRVMIRSGYRDGTATQALVTALAAVVREQHVALLFCRCRPHLLGFYERLGFRAYTAAMTAPVAGLVIPLVLILDDTPYLERVQSPLRATRHRVPWDAARAREVSALLPPVPPIRKVTAADAESEWVRPPLWTAQGDGMSGLCAGLDRHDVARLLVGSHAVACRRYDRLITAQHADRALFVVVRGTLQVQYDGRAIAVLRSGEVCGEMAMLRHGRRTADVVVSSDEGTVLCLGEKQLGLGASDPRVAARVWSNLTHIRARRLGITAETTKRGLIDPPACVMAPVTV